MVFHTLNCPLQILVLSHKKLLNVATRQAKQKPLSADRRAPTMCQATSSASSQASVVWISGQHGRLTVVEPLPPIKVKNLKDLRLCQYMLEKYLTGLGSRSLGIGPQMCCSPSLDTRRKTQSSLSTGVVLVVDLEILNIPA
eukprot:XP_017450663.1 PREDICTED: uncharacterized protein RGD1565071 isoform X2 [Rattus norvegicus]